MSAVIAVVVGTVLLYLLVIAVCSWAPTPEERAARRALDVRQKAAARAVRRRRRPSTVTSSGYAPVTRTEKR